MSAQPPPPHMFKYCVFRQATSQWTPRTATSLVSICKLNIAAVHQIHLLPNDSFDLRARVHVIERIRVGRLTRLSCWMQVISEGERQLLSDLIYKLVQTQKTCTWRRRQRQLHYGHRLHRKLIGRTHCASARSTQKVINCLARSVEHGEMSTQIN